MAVRWKLILRNPADAVEPPTYQQKEIQVLDEGRTAWLLEFAREHRVYTPILFGVAVATRRGELLVLQWSDVDKEVGVVAVRRSVEQTKGTLTFKDTKGKRSRVLSLPETVVDALKSHQEQQGLYKIALGAAYQDNGLVFLNEDGTIWRPDSFTSAFVLVSRRAGLRGVRFHDLRHSHASQLLRQGVHPKIVQERLGHSGMAITMDIYSHLQPGMQEEAAHKIDHSLRAAIKKRSATSPQ